MTSNSAPEVQQAARQCVDSVVNRSTDCARFFAVLSSLCFSLGILNEKRDRRLFILLAFAVPFSQLGQLLQSFRIKLGILETAKQEFEADFISMNGYHSIVTSEIQRALELFEEIIDAKGINYEEVVMVLLDINKYIRGLQEKANFIDRLFGNVPAAGNQI